MKDLVLARETRACVILFRIHSGNYHIIIFICRLFNELQKHEWKILFLWMFVFLLPHALQELKTLKARCFVRFYTFFRFDFFPFLLFSKLDFQDIEIQLQDLTSFKTGSSSQIYQDRKIHLPTPLTPNPKSNRTRHWRRGKPTCSNCQILYWFRSYFDEVYCVKSALWPWLCAIYYQ